MDFENLLQRFASAVGAHDSAGLAGLFTPDGCYDDYFFGLHRGREEIAAMLDRFHVGGEDFFWEFRNPVCDGRSGYAGYLFSYRSKEPESAGRTIVFEGIARFELQDGLIARYEEAFDRGVAFSQLGYATERIGKLLDRYARQLAGKDDVVAHLGRRPRTG
ncbi:nuclear transport factor 2 family protein [Burkholderiaceae bacterium FT117]|uniref:nuclear transport factor 2 family protein n=1 Tax=Zeimonas sediminis TaxID=2944268 RepID=UPI002343024C|nr:nuclear transport factor 2 family protein [Zeimonas sediminis]MCM5569293.1 nuclear transport factor 2 family protein [Zeimonas sediminis]